ncbi:hypothetical protein [Paraburkholderia graminis]
MPQTNTGFRDLGELTLRELAGLHILNDALRQAECWILARSVREYSGEPASKAVGPSRTPPTSGSPEELTFSASVSCMSVAAEPLGVAAKRHAARLDATAVAGQISAPVDVNEMVVAGESLFGLRPCALFRTLITELRGDWLQMLEVRALRVQFGASACREFEIEAAFVPRRTSNFCVPFHA